MNKEMQATKIYQALEKKGFDLDKAGFIKTITNALDSPAPDLAAETLRQAQDENARLREALKKIANADWILTDMEMGEIARAALARETKGN